MSKKIAFFDFDGTITTKDTMLEFIKFCSGKRVFIAGFLFNIHYLVAYKLGIISNQLAKEHILRQFFKDMSQEDFRSHCRRFALEQIPALLRPQAIGEIRSLQQQGFEIVVVTASAEDWVAPWAATMGIALIGTKLVVHNGKLTGNINGVNCHGEEKVKRIKSVYRLDAYDVIHAYGDTGGDKPMLRIANKEFYKPFRH